MLISRTDKRGNLIGAQPAHDDQRRVLALIQRLRDAYNSLPGVRATIDDRIADAVQAQGQGRGAGHSDAVARAAAAIEGYQQQHRALTRAMRSVEDSVEHLRVEAERSLGKLEPVGTERPMRCPRMVVLRQTVHAGGEELLDEVLMRCDHLTAYKLGDRGNPIDYDPDGYCERHRAEANEAMRRAVIEQNRRQRRNGTG